MNVGRLFLMVAAGTLLYGGAAYAQTEKRVIEAPKEAPIQLEKATDKSPAVNLAAVGKEVTPGLIEVSPSSIRGKRLVLGPGGASRHICLGRWDMKTKTCMGTFIEG
jgi:hypothetical protein